MEASPTVADAAAVSALTTDHDQLHETISCLSDPETEKAFRLSGCRNLTDFIASSDPLRVRISLTGTLVSTDEDSDDAVSNIAVDGTSHPDEDFDGSLVEGRKDSDGDQLPLSFLSFSAERVRSDLEERKEAGSFPCFLRALATSCKNLYLENVRFESDEELSALCQVLASPLCKVEYLFLSRIKVLTSSSNSVSDASCLEDALPRITELLLDNSTSLTTSRLRFSATLMYRYPHPCGETTPHRKLEVDIWHGGLDLFLQLHSGFLAVLANNTSSLQELSVYAGWFPFRTDAALEEALCQMLVRNVSLTSLSLEDVHMSGKGVHALFTSLETNLNLSYLSLRDCHGADWPSITWVLDSIRINGIITQLDLEKTPLDSQHNKAAIEIQLAKNRANVESLKVLHSEASTHATQLVQPTSVRFFLCGFPYSGKTTLSTSLVKYWTKPTLHHVSLRSRFSHAGILGRSPERTQGIKVTNLNKDGVKISLWDLAGQKEFHAFHDYMLPSFANEATPSMFLFVWSPIYVDEKTGREQKEGPMNQLKAKGVDNFRQDFKYWLMFIASKTLKSLKFRPKVFVVITRADKIKQTGFTKSWVQDIFYQTQREFKEYLDLNMDWVFEIDARYPYAVEQLALHVFDAASNLVKSVPPVYKACDDARRVLSNIAQKRHLMTKDELFHVCGAWLKTSNVEVQEAIAHHLSSTGDLIYFRSTLLVIVDVEWFCHCIMGRLLNSGWANQNVHPEQGVWPLHCLQELLVEKAEANSARGKNRDLIRVVFNMKRRSKSRDVRQKLVTKGEDLANILIELGLACPLQDGEPGIFIPASLRTHKHHRRQIEPCDYLTGDRQGIKTYMGRRLRCKDTICTFFTPGFFPALQVKFRGLYSSTTKHGSEPVAPTADVIAFAHEGVEVFMEFCRPEGEEQFIDILVQSHLDLDGTIEWIHENVLENVELVRAGSRGLQGVELAHEVVCPACVEKLDGLEERKTQAVSLEELRASLKSRLEQKGSLAKLEDCLNSAFHTWHTARKCVSPVIDLLGNEETGRIVESFRQKVVMELNDALGIDIESEVCNVEEPESSVSSSPLLTGGSQFEQLVVNGMGEMHKDIRKMHKGIQELQKDVRKIVASLDTIHKVALPKLQQRVQELLKFSKEGEAGRLPRFFVVTEGEGRLRKIVATVVPGLKNVKLQLMCEHGPHLLGDNYGLAFQTLEDGFLKRGLPYITTVLKVICVAARVSAHVFSGLGDAVPDLTRGLALIVDTPLQGLSAYSEPDAPLKSSASRTNFQEGQQWLRDILDMHNCKESKQIHDKFGLTCVIYPDLRVGWLCDEHRSEGQHWCL